MLLTRPHLWDLEKGWQRENREFFIVRPSGNWFLSIVSRPILIVFIYWNQTPRISSFRTESATISMIHNQWVGLTKPADWTTNLLWTCARCEKSFLCLQKIIPAAVRGIVLDKEFSHPQMAKEHKGICLFEWIRGSKFVDFESWIRVGHELPVFNRFQSR